MVTIHQIKTAAAQVYGVTVEDIESQRRDHRTLKARYAVAWLARAEPRYTLAMIGRELGRRDHSTIWNAINRYRAGENLKELHRIQALLVTDDEVRRLSEAFG